MPLFKEKNGPNFQLAIWEITEPEDFFKRKTRLENVAKLAHRRLEFQASRYLLQELHPSIALEAIRINADGKPFLPGGTFHFSISHSFPYVGVILSDQLVGIDVQTYQEKIGRLQHKFLSDKEQVFFRNDIRQITLAWAAKEAAFKWSEHAHFDFIRHLPIRSYQLSNQTAAMTVDVRKEQPHNTLNLKGRLEDAFGWMFTLPE
ncbi:MAG TPA: 4'-phosphopantetheinyl transferase superfamily protein [Edaphocola sp.]|nr:4'-phosphopantetheinyl transferase superfamily protein [Edaphocola sp.]